MRIAVITGASSGLGKEFVVQLAKTEKLDEIWVIARRLDRLEALQSEVETKIRPISLDLTLEESFEAYRQMLEAEKPDVAILVNASGFGRFDAFENTELDVFSVSPQAAKPRRRIRVKPNAKILFINTSFIRR